VLAGAGLRPVPGGREDRNHKQLAAHVLLVVAILAPTSRAKRGRQR
jgi:hypothetical protein